MVCLLPFRIAIYSSFLPYSLLVPSSDALLEESPSCELHILIQFIRYLNISSQSFTMRRYQLQGLNWIVSLDHNGLNGILADEMVHILLALIYAC
jgi:hypothetical protein